MSITEIILILACNSRSFSHIITSCIPRSEKAIAIASNLHVSPAFILGCSLVWFGAYIRTTSYRKLGEQFTFTIGIAKNHRLVTTGIYSVVRHPAYAGLMIGPAGSTLSYFSSGSLWNVYHGAPVSLRSLALLWWAMVFVAFPMCILMRVPQEERMMRKSFPEEWEVYTKRTPYRLIPYIY